jgi:hypothetical protein
MAITTDDQKLAIMDFCNMLESGMILNETSPFSQGDKQQLLWGYPDVLWVDEGAAPKSPLFLVNLGTMMNRC